MNHHHSINYLEIPSRDIASSKTFFNKVFGWCYVDYGPEYSCFMDAGITGGFYQADVDFTLLRGSPLIVLYSNDLESTRLRLSQREEKLPQGYLLFLGGRRFHFTEPCGNEYAVWSE
nr:VOC family protein [Shewanella putrefaciens]